MAKLAYSRNGDHCIPDLTITKQIDKPIGRYGRMRKRYLKESRPGLYSSLILSEKLYPHLLEIDEAANRRIEMIMPELIKSVGVTEKLKAVDPMRRNNLIRVDL